MRKDYPHLFSELRLAGQTIKNRIVFPAMGTNFANPDGTLSNALKEYYIERARGGAGMLIMECSLVNFPKNAGKVEYRQVIMNQRLDKVGIHDFIEKIHSYGAKFLFQPHHGGWRANRLINSDIVAPYDTEKLEGNWFPARGLSTEEVYQLIDSYVEASKFAQECGADGVEIMSGHGYLIYSFISDVINHRTDEFGGSLENRTRVIREIIKGIRESCGEKFIIGVKLGILDDPTMGHLVVEEGAEIAELVKTAGPDFIETSMGFYSRDSMVIETYNKPDYFRRPLVEGVRKRVGDLPLMTVGKIRDPKMADEIIASGTAQLIGVGRQMICDPFWPTKLIEGREEEIRRCLCCNQGCIARMRVGKEVRCVVNPFVGFEYKYHEHAVDLAGKSKKVVIVGGGLAGMQCAIVASKRGHDVTILEAQSELGGMMKYASIPPYKSLVSENMNWFISEVGRQNVEVRLNCAPTASEIADMKPDVVVLATGFKENVPPIPGADHAVSAISVLKGDVELPDHGEIVVIGGGLIGSETAHYLAEKGNKVSVVEMLDTICEGFESTVKPIIMDDFAEYGVDVYTSAKVEEIGENAVSFKDCNAEEKTIPSDVTVYATGVGVVRTDLADALREKGIPVRTINEYATVSNFRQATLPALEIAYDL